MNQPVLFSASRPTESDPPRTGLAAAVVAVPAAVVGLLDDFLLLPHAPAIEASATTAATDFPMSERLPTFLTFPPCAPPEGST
jgi:hypothetical protein